VCAVDTTVVKYVEAKNDQHVCDKDSGMIDLNLKLPLVYRKNKDERIPKRNKIFFFGRRPLNNERVT
jgi:hypothetical protein